MKFDFGGATKHRDKVIKTLTGGVAMLFDKNKIDYIEGLGSVTDDANVKVGGSFDGTEIEAGTVLLACGSVPRPVAGLQFGKRIVDTAGMWLHIRPAEAAGRDRRGGVGHRGGVGVRAARHRGGAAGGARPDPPAGG